MAHGRYRIHHGGHAQLVRIALGLEARAALGGSFRRYGWLSGGQPDRSCIVPTRRARTKRLSASALRAGNGGAGNSDRVACPGRPGTHSCRARALGGTNALVVDQPHRSGRTGIHDRLFQRRYSCLSLRPALLPARVDSAPWHTGHHTTTRSAGLCLRSSLRWSCAWCTVHAPSMEWPGRCCSFASVHSCSLPPIRFFPRAFATFT